jgi:putative spermidine/putrescine transport system permease protein
MIRRAFMLAPALIVVIGLFGGGLLDSLLQSLGLNPALGATTPTFQAYHDLLWGPQHRETIWTGLALSLWISIASTVISTVIAIGLALAIRAQTTGSAVWTFWFQFNLPIPHLIAAIGTLFVLAQSGLLARIAMNFGWITTPADFPLWVRDPHGIGIITAYVWKEVPFIGLIVLAALRSLSGRYEQAAQTLGANRWQRFRWIFLPLIAPSVGSAALIVFAFTFGAYEIPALLGVRYPRALPVTALRFFLDADLNARAEAMALSLMITAVLLVVVFFYLRLRS